MHCLVVSGSVGFVRYRRSQLNMRLIRSRQAVTRDRMKRLNGREEEGKAGITVTGYLSKAEGA